MTEADWISHTWSWMASPPEVLALVKDRNDWIARHRTLNELYLKAAARVRELEREQVDAVIQVGKDNWPEAVTDGLTSRCCDCDTAPPFDYRVTDEFWNTNVPVLGERVGVICLPCMNRRCGGEGLAAALVEVQWTGFGHTVVLRPTVRYEYARTPESEDTE